MRVGTVRSDNEIDIQVVTTAEQFMHAIAVRAICFMEETGLSVSQTIDGNDYQATHFVIYAKREPIGATRLRWFRQFRQNRANRVPPGLSQHPHSQTDRRRHLPSRRDEGLSASRDSCRAQVRQPVGADARLRTRCRASGRRDGRPRAVHRAGQTNTACAGGHYHGGRSQSAVPRGRAMEFSSRVLSRA